MLTLGYQPLAPLLEPNYQSDDIPQTLPHRTEVCWLTTETRLDNLSEEAAKQTLVNAMELSILKEILKTFDGQPHGLRVPFETYCRWDRKEKSISLTCKVF